VWQSQAPRGTSKLTGVAGCAAMAKLARVRSSAPPAMDAAMNLRRVSMRSS